MQFASHHTGTVCPLPRHIWTISDHCFSIIARFAFLISIPRSLRVRWSKLVYSNPLQFDLASGAYFYMIGAPAVGVIYLTFTVYAIVELFYIRANNLDNRNLRILKVCELFNTMQIIFYSELPYNSSSNSPSLPSLTAGRVSYILKLLRLIFSSASKLKI